MADDNKYTASQWAAIYGGHDPEQINDSMNLKLLNELSESRLFRTKNIAASVDLDDAANLAFMYLMVLNIFNKDYDYSPLASEYAARSITFRNFDTFRTSGTDLYISLNRLMGKDQKYTNDKDIIAKKRISPNKTDILQYLTHIGNNKSNSAYEQKMLLRFQRQFNIQDSMLKSMRRLVGDWENLNQNQRSLLVTRSVQFMRSKAPRSEMMKPLMSFQKRGNYIVNDKNDKKKKIWNKPIVKAAAAIGGIYALSKGADALGKRMGNTSYQSPDKSGLRKFQPRNKQ
ncbi:hypothetical protein N9E09_00220 [bacterium]|jgi:hypothetical protein|nr:hypothetical protein [bacterium]